ncbi:MAG: baseplate J/gp47 family protein [Janthinobacterium lividum]
MQLPLKNFASLVADMSAAVQVAGSQLVDVSVGSVLRAVIEANASLALWMQWLIMLVLSLTRASTSSGGDLDTWMADFGLVRLPGVAATGTVTFARITSGVQALVPAGAIVRSADGTVTAAVMQDTTRADWSASAAGYVLAASAASADYPVAATTPGIAGNVLAGSLSQLSTAIPSVDSVSNALALQGGTDAESDVLFRSRFQAYINSRSRATMTAVEFAVSSVQPGLKFVVAENQDADGQAHVGNFVVTVDDGSGTPPGSLLEAVYSAVDAIRPVGTTFAVLPPQVVSAAVVLTLGVQPGGNATAISGAVAAQITAWVQALGIGASLPVSRIAGLAYATDPAVANVTMISINGGPYDLTPPINGVVRLATLVVN